eukprot:2647572-Lingulodinium_polyedra.AAC.1
MARIAKTSVRAPWWFFGAFEARWGLARAPRCPVAAARDSAAVVAFAGRSCGPQPSRQRALEMERHLE